MTTLVSETLCDMNIDLLRDSQAQLCQLLYIPCELSQLLEHLWAGMLSPDRSPQVLPQTLEVFAGIFMSVELSRGWLLQVHTNVNIPEGVGQRSITYVWKCSAAA